jgi:hypothetical protein
MDDQRPTDAEILERHGASPLVLWTLDVRRAMEEAIRLNSPDANSLSRRRQVDRSIG